jgi:hypothetical protein
LAPRAAAACRRWGPCASTLEARTTVSEVRLKAAAAAGPVPRLRPPFALGGVAASARLALAAVGALAPAGAVAVRGPTTAEAFPALLDELPQLAEPLRNGEPHITALASTTSPALRHGACGAEGAVATATTAVVSGEAPTRRSQGNESLVCLPLTPGAPMPGLLAACRSGHGRCGQGR